MTQGKKNNRFADLLGTRDDEQPDQPSAASAAAEGVQAGPSTTHHRGESTGGKRANPDYTQISAFIRKSTHKRTKAALIYDAEQRDFGDLVESLLQEWLAKQA